MVKKKKLKKSKLLKKGGRKNEDIFLNGVPERRLTLKAVVENTSEDWIGNQC